MATEIISCVEARAQGLPRYFTGKPCKHGHVSLRITANETCETCYKKTLERYRHDNPERIRETDRQHRAKTAETHRERDRLWRLKNNDAVRIADRKRHAEGDPELHRLHGRARKARVRNAEGSHRVEEIVALLERQKWKCAGHNCKASLRKLRHIDHIQPLARGGSNSISNLQGLCPTCNLRKHAKDPFEWARENGALL